MQKLYKKINNLLIVLLLITNVLTPSISVFATGTDVETPVVEVVESVVESELTTDITEENNVANTEGEEELELEVATEESETSEANSEDEVYFSPVDPSAYLTNVTLTHTSGQSANGGEIGYHDNFNLSYAFNFPNNVAINNGDTLTLSIPNEMRLLRDDSFQITKDGAPIGTAQLSVANKTIVVTFNDYFQNNPNDKNMQLTVGTAWDTTVVSGGESLNLVFNGRSVPINVGTKPQIGTTEVLQKWGSAVQNDANRYNWFMRINNARHNLNSVEIIDTLGPGQELDVNSIRIDFLNSYEPWQPYTGTAPTPVWVEKTTRGFKLNFNNLDAVVAINYQVVVTDPNLAEYQNSVELKANGQTKDNITRTVANQSGSGSGGGSGIKPTPKIGFEVRKELAGRTLREGEFNFVLTKNEAAGPREVGRAQNTADGRVIFEGFPYVAAGTYNYTVTEEAGSDPLVEYSNERIDISVVVVNNNGQLEATVNYPEDKIFNNRITPPDSTSAVIKANVLAQGCVVGEIEVELLNEDMTKVLEVVRATATGQVTFAAIPYGKEGVTTYKIRQKASDTAHVTYDKEVKTVTVTVKKHDTENKLVATVNPNIVIFNNACKASTPGQAVVKAKVAATGCVVAPVEVELLEANGTTVIETATSNNAGEVTFKALPQNVVGTKTYKVRQKVTADTAHITYDKEVKTVTVNVTKDNANNTYVATVNPETVIFNNTCKEPTPADAVIKASVAANGCVVAPIEVELLDSTGNNVLQTVRSTAEGKVTFAAIPQNAVGNVTYKVRQKNPVDTAHVRFDKTVKEVTVRVTKDANTNKFVATVNPTEVMFNNECLPPTPTTATIKATVKAEGCVVGPVKVELVDEQGQVVATATANDKGEVSFNVPNLNMAKTYNYKLRQKDVVDTPHVRYDKAEKPVAVTVTLNNTTNQFEATTPETVVFNNECLPPTPTNATIKATVKAEGCVVGEVKVELVDDKGQVVATATANDKGEVSFNVPNLNAAKTYNYKLRQKDVVDTPHVRYDKAEKPVAVTVTLNNTTNQFEATTPETVVFNNECLPPTPINATIKATVKAEGCVVGPVKVELVDDKGQVVATATANDKGEVSFNVPNLNMAKTYNYKLRQKDVVDTPHVRYDKAEKPVAVTVTLNNTTNQFEATTPETVVFNNECLPPTPTTATITAMLQSEGCVVGKIKVELVDKDGKVIQAKEAEPNGKVTFDPITYDKAGENTYTVRQVAEDTPFVKYDKTPKQVKVSVTEDKKENKLEATVSEEPTFTNECIKPTPAEVIIEAKVKNEGCEVAPEATQFELLRDGKVVQTTTSKDGKVVFNKEVFDKAEKVTYQIRQLPGKTPKVIYDKTVVTVTIDVTNNDKNTLMANTSYTNDGTFVNKCEPTKEKPELPKTGEFNTVFILPIAVLAMVGALVTVSFQKKEN